MRLSKAGNSNSVTHRLRANVAQCGEEEEEGYAAVNSVDRMLLPQTAWQNLQLQNLQNLPPQQNRDGECKVVWTGLDRGSQNL